MKTRSATATVRARAQPVAVTTRTGARSAAINVRPVTQSTTTMTTTPARPRAQPATPATRTRARSAAVTICPETKSTTTARPGTQPATAPAPPVRITRTTQATAAPKKTQPATAATPSVRTTRTTRTTRATASIIQKQSAMRSTIVVGGLKQHYATILGGFHDGEISDSQLAWLAEEEVCFQKQQTVDNLLELPTARTSTYLDSRKQTKWDNRYEMTSQCKPPIGERHPKILKAKKNGTYTKQLNEYYQGLPPKVNIPLAGTALNPAFPEPESNPKEESNQSKADLEDNFHNRPSIKLPVPDHLKAMLVDDWENVTKNNQLVPLPHVHPVDEILNDYLAHEKPTRQEGSASLDILEETIAGLREYFDKCLGRILLYRFERTQYHNMHQLWNQADGKHKSAVDTYGAEHMSRLLVSLPELIAQTNMDQQSVNRLREELMKFTNWFSRHVTKYFVSEYETPGAEYVEQARSV